MSGIGRLMGRSLAAAATAATLLFAGGAQARVDLSAQAVEPWADRTLGEVYRQGRASGVAIVVVQDGKVTFQKSYGYADWGLKKPVDPAVTRFRVGSVSKTFTALAVAQLLEQGRIKSLDDPANRYLKRMQLPNWRGKDVTIWDLLTHRGGFREKSWPYDPTVPPLSRKDLAIQAPGQDEKSSDGSDYCNYCTGVAGVMIEDITGELLPDYLDHAVFRPLGMTGSLLNASRTPSPNVGMAYNIEKGGSGKLFKYLSVPEFYAPAGTVEATVDDMGRYMIAMLGGPGPQVVKPETRQLLLEPHVRNHPAGSGFGMVWMGHTWNGEEVREHGGQLPGYHSILSLFPDSNGGIFISSFAAEIPKTKPSVGGFYGLTGFNYREMIYRQFLGVEPFKPIATPKDLKQYEGIYQSSRRDETWPLRMAGLLGGSTIKIEAVKDGLMIGGKGPYRAVAPDVFRYPELNGNDPFVPFTNRESILFMRDAQGQVAHLTQPLALHTARPQTLFERQSTQLALAGVGLLSLLGLAAVFWRLPRSGAARLMRRTVLATAVVAPGTLALCLCAFIFKWIGFGATTTQWQVVAWPLAGLAVLSGALAVASTLVAGLLWRGVGGVGIWTKLNATLVALGGLALSLLFLVNRGG